MTGQHTDGPYWVAEDKHEDPDLGSHVWVMRGSEDEPVILAEVFEFGIDTKQQLARAELLASAPDLAARVERLEAQRDALAGALREAIAVGLVPKSSAAEGGAMRHSAQVRAADRVRAALATMEDGE